MKWKVVMTGFVAALAILAVSTPPQAETFSFDSIVARAEALSKDPWKERPSTVPKFIQQLTYDQHRDIRFREDKTLWKSLALPFQIRFFHPGYVQNRSIIVREIVGKEAREIPFSPEDFDYGKNKLKETPPKDMGFAGFRVHHPINRPDYLDEVIVFMGASYFRAVARELRYGTSARGLAIDTVPKKKEGREEFPVFTEFWVERPASGSNGMSIYALMESKSISGAYKFTVIPGDETVVNVTAALFPRKDIDTMGVAPLTSMFWYGENSSTTYGDFRPEVHDTDGLLMERGDKRFLWRPLSNEGRLQVNNFHDEDPRGFGLIQRDRDFQHYQDLEAQYNVRPSVWVQPLQKWGHGSVELVQIPTRDEFMDNIVAYWRFDRPVKARERFDLQYNVYFFKQNDSRPLLAKCISTRIGRPGEKKAGDENPEERKDEVKFVLDFAGRQLNDLPPNEQPVAEVTVSEAGQLTETHVMRNEFSQGWRATVRVKPISRKPVEVTCTLKKGDQVLSETWTYTWQP